MLVSRASGRRLTVTGCGFGGRGFFRSHEPLPVRLVPGKQAAAGLPGLGVPPRAGR